MRLSRVLRDISAAPAAVSDPVQPFCDAIGRWMRQRTVPNAALIKSERTLRSRPTVRHSAIRATARRAKCCSRVPGSAGRPNWSDPAARWRAMTRLGRSSCDTSNCDLRLPPTFHKSGSHYERAAANCTWSPICSRAINLAAGRDSASIVGVYCLTRGIRGLANKYDMCSSALLTGTKHTVELLPTRAYLLAMKKLSWQADTGRSLCTPSDCGTWPTHSVVYRVSKKCFREVDSIDANGFDANVSLLSSADMRLGVQKLLWGFTHRRCSFLVFPGATVRRFGFAFAG